MRSTDGTAHTAAQCNTFRSHRHYVPQQLVYGHKHMYYEGDSVLTLTIAKIVRVCSN